MPDASEDAAFDHADDSEEAIESYRRKFLAGGDDAARTIRFLKDRCEKTADSFLLMQVVFSLDHGQRVTFFENFLDCEPCRALALQEAEPNRRDAAPS